MMGFLLIRDSAEARRSAEPLAMMTRQRRKTARATGPVQSWPDPDTDAHLMCSVHHGMQIANVQSALHRTPGSLGPLLTARGKRTSRVLLNACAAVASTHRCPAPASMVVSTVFAGQNAEKEVSDKIWLVTFMHYDPGFFDHETCRLESVDNPFEPKVLPMSPV
jgi:hypothetical protein